MLVLSLEWPLSAGSSGIVCLCTEILVRHVACDWANSEAHFTCPKVDTWLSGFGYSAS
jgi:hypothetical protein